MVAGVPCIVFTAWYIIVKCRIYKSTIYKAEKASPTTLLNLPFYILRS